MTKKLFWSNFRGLGEQFPTHWGFVGSDTRYTNSAKFWKIIFLSFWIFFGIDSKSRIKKSQKFRWKNFFCHSCSKGWKNNSGRIFFGFDCLGVETLGPTTKLFHLILSLCSHSSVRRPRISQGQRMRLHGGLQARPADGPVSLRPVRGSAEQHHVRLQAVL